MAYQPRKTYERITPLRHAAHLASAEKWTLQWLQWKLIEGSARNIRGRFLQLPKLIEKGQPGALAIARRMEQDEQSSPMGYGATSFARYLSSVFLVDTYILMGDKGRGRTFWLLQIAKLITRARALSRGTDSIQWYLDGFGDVLSGFLPEGAFARLELTTIKSDNATINGLETIFIDVIATDEHYPL